MSDSIKMWHFNVVIGVEIGLNNLKMITYTIKLTLAKRNWDISKRHSLYNLTLPTLVFQSSKHRFIENQRNAGPI